MEYCKYGASLEEMLRDRLIGGTNDKRLQRRNSLSRRPLTWHRHTSLLQRTSRTYKRRNRQGKYTLRANDRDMLPQGAVTRGCYCCGGQHHQSKCGFRTSDCQYCGKRGHVAKVCQSRLNGFPPIKGKPQSTHLLTEADSDVYTLFAVASGNLAPINATVKVNDAELTLQVDTGVSLSLISETTFNDLQKQEQVLALSPSTITLRMYSGRF